MLTMITNSTTLPPKRYTVKATTKKELYLCVKYLIIDTLANLNVQQKQHISHYSLDSTVMSMDG